MSKEKIDPMATYYIVSLKHTSKKDAYVTLWRPDNKGYCYPIQYAGEYNGFEIENGYHNCDESLPLTVGDLYEHLVNDDQGRSCFKVSPSLIDELLKRRQNLTTKP